MKKLFVSYKVALQVMQKGFDEPCLAKYVNFTGLKEPQLLIYKDSIYGENHMGKNSDEDINDTVRQDCTGPLYQQVTDWLREKNDIDLSVNSNDLGYVFTIFRKRASQCYIDRDVYETHYGALDKGIEESLKLIK
jgi:hypothetical protein